MHDEGIGKLEDTLKTIIAFVLRNEAVVVDQDLDERLKNLGMLHPKAAHGGVTVYPVPPIFTFDERDLWDECYRCLASEGSNKPVQDVRSVSRKDDAYIE
jgi:hypothetical protein